MIKYVLYFSLILFPFQIFDLKKQKYENERKSAEEQLRKDQLGAFGRMKERLFGKR